MLKSSQEKGWILYMSEKAKVYFSKEISPEKVLEMYQLLGKKLDGKVAIKLHSGEAGNQNFLKPEFLRVMNLLILSGKCLRYLLGNLNAVA